MTDQHEQQLVEQETQSIVALRIGMLVLASARQEAELNAWVRKARAAEKAADDHRTPQKPDA